VSSEEAAWKEDCGAKPEIVAFNDVIGRVAVEDTSRVWRAFRSFDVDFERRGPA
jgi:hypothetical protein